MIQSLQPLLLGRKRKRPKHSDLNSLISFLHDKSDGLNKRQRDYDGLYPVERRRKRRKLRNSIQQLRNDDKVQNAFYNASSYRNIRYFNDYADDSNHIVVEEAQNADEHTYCLWTFHHQKYVNYVLSICFPLSPLV